MEEDTVEPQDHDVDTNDMVDTMVEEHEVDEPVQEEKLVPLSALQKERKKRQEMEQELNWERQRSQRTSDPEPEEDNSYETATRGDLIHMQNEAVRIVDEKQWIRSNPEKHEYVSENLKEFLKQRPNLASAIQDAPNRFEEAYTLMNALTTKQQQALKPSGQKKVAPNSPNAVPKASNLNAAIDVMSMTDKEFSAWREQQRKRR